MKVSVLGAGLMGSPFCLRLLGEGHEVTVYNRSSDKLTHLISKGANITTNPFDAIANSKIIIMMLSGYSAITEVLFSTPIDMKDKLFVQMGTISPNESRELFTRISRLGGKYIEAPVLGSIPEALSGKLIVMVGGSLDDFNYVVPILDCLGEKPILIGDVGTAAALKLAMNQLIAALTTAFSLSLGFCMRNGVDTEIYMDVVRKSALYAQTYDKKLKKYLERNFDGANFSAKHLNKDVNLFLADAESLGMDCSSLQGIAKITTQAIKQGLGDKDYSAIYEIINPEVN
ncbi:MAG: NAD(P)-dependent oxidoreductase [Methylococcales bacterium]|jgi:3-hydroxyisobutyrate dehydrogenase|nr:NAD(P)-dependent oxidoreductase [Methylococcales bacterium]